MMNKILALLALALVAVHAKPDCSDPKSLTFSEVKDCLAKQAGVFDPNYRTVPELDDVLDSLKDVPELEKDDYLVYSSDEECQACTEVVKEVQDYLSESDNTQNAIDTVVNICTKWFSRDECEEYVGELVGTAIATIEGMSPNEVCTFASMCASSQSATPMPVWEEKKEAVPKRHLLGENECVTSLENMCNNLPLAQRCGRLPTCMALLKKDTYLLNKWDTDADKKDSFKSAASTFPGFSALVKYASIKSEMECEMCTESVDEVQSYLKEDGTVDQLVKEALQLCSQYSLGDYCVEVVNEYLEDILVYVRDDVNATAVCTEMYFCGDYEDFSFGNEKDPACPSDETECFGGCCPFPNAVCCDDGEHCCPESYMCSEGYCVQGSNMEFMRFLYKPKSDKSDKRSKDVRYRRHVADVHDEDVTSFMADLIPGLDLETLMSEGKKMVDKFMASFNEGPCSACKLIMECRAEHPLPEDVKEHLMEHAEKVREHVCEKAEEHGIRCPTADEVAEILVAAENQVDAASTECPIVELCQGGNYEDVLRELWMRSYEALMSQFSEDNWDQLVEHLNVFSEENPEAKPYIDEAIQHAEYFKDDEEKKEALEGFMRDQAESLMKKRSVN